MKCFITFLILSGMSVNADTYGDWQYGIANNQAVITGYLGSSTELIIPNEVNGIPVVEVVWFWLPDNSLRMIVPNSVERICKSLFSQTTQTLDEIIFLGNAPTLVDDGGVNKFPVLPTIKVSFGTSGWSTSLETYPPRPVIMTNAYALTPLSIETIKGVATASPSGPWYAVGSSVSVNASPQQGYKFASWSGDVVSTNNPILVQMYNNKMITANFGPDNNDSDGDGLSNYQEVIVFNTNPNQPEINSPVPGLFLASEKMAERVAGQNDVINSPNAYSLYTENQIHNLGLGGIILNRNTNNQLLLKYQILQSSDLQNWSSYQQYELPITNTPSDRMFLRVQAVGQ